MVPSARRARLTLPSPRGHLRRRAVPQTREPAPANSSGKMARREAGSGVQV